MMNCKLQIKPMALVLLIANSNSIFAAELKNSTPDKATSTEVVSAELINLKKSSDKKFILTQQQWSIPKDAQSILNMQSIAGVMQNFFQYKKRIIVIRHAGGEVGILWASELKAWLVSLGISSKRIELQTGNIKSNELELFVGNLVLH